MSDTLRIRNWDKWQSYRKDRGQPPWIKIHRQVMRNPEWVSLSDAQRGQLVAIWLLAADRDGVIPASPAVLRKLCYLDGEPDLKLFIDKGFIDPPQDGVTLTPERRQDDAPETETETETETEKKDASADADGASAPVSISNETPEARLWRLGPTDLVALGVKEQQARKLIGSWRRDTGDDCERVLGAIMRAREYAVAEPVAWITASLKSGRPNGKLQTVQSAAAELVENIRKLNERPGVRSGEGTTPVRLLSSR